MPAASAQVLIPPCAFLPCAASRPRTQVERAPQLGAKDFPPKPYPTKTLLKELRGILVIPA